MLLQEIANLERKNAKLQIQITIMNDPEIEALNKSLKKEIRENAPTFAEEQNLYSLKNYIDRRLELLEKKLMAKIIERK